MPGDNVEMVCDLVHDVAAEVGSRYVALLRSILLLTSDHSFTLREGGKTSEFPFGVARKLLLIVLCSRDWYCH
jgi:translation elongation factor EF-Tu-like GTPase